MAFTISVQLIDAYGRVGNKTFDNDRALIADALTDAATLIAAIEAASLCGVVSHTIARKTPVGDAADATANIDAGMTIHCTLADATGYGLKIPAPVGSIINIDGSIAVSDAKVTDLVALFQTGGHFMVSDGELIDSIRYGELDR